MPGGGPTLGVSLAGGDLDFAEVRLAHAEPSSCTSPSLEGPLSVVRAEAPRDTSGGFGSCYLDSPKPNNHKSHKSPQGKKKWGDKNFHKWQYLAQDFLSWMCLATVAYTSQGIPEKPEPQDCRIQ